jgi:sporulation protein YlmC with PRC-barrel domain
MKSSNIAPWIGAFAILASPYAVAQTTSPPATSPPAEMPSARPDTPAVPSTVTPPKSPTQASPTTPTPPAERAAKDTKTDPLVGLAVFGSDGQKLGEVQDVKTEADGKVQAIHIKTGGFLGFGGRMVAIPSDKFTRSGQNVQVNMTYNEVTALPKVEDKRS